MKPETASFIANVFLNDPDRAKMSANDAAYNIKCWKAEGIEVPEDLTATDLMVEWNEMLSNEISKPRNAKPYKAVAAEFVEAIEKLAATPEALENFQSYLEMHFDTWLKRFCKSPECITSEMQSFANICDE